MRFLTVAILSLVLMAPTFADAQSQNQSRSFGSATCRERVPCPDSDPNMSFTPEALAGSASSCITTFFGYPSPGGGGFFDTNAGLDGSNCLTAKPGILPKGMGAALSPVCCIVESQDTTCHFHCDLVSH